MCSVLVSRSGCSVLSFVFALACAKRFMCLVFYMRLIVVGCVEVILLVMRSSLFRYVLILVMLILLVFD